MDAPANAVVSRDQRPTKAIVIETRDSLVKSTSMIGMEDAKKREPSASRERVVVVVVAAAIPEKSSKLPVSGYQIAVTVLL